MSLLGTVVVFTVVWWLIFFMLLPLGVSAEKHVLPGHAASAPARPRVFRKAFGATVVAVLVTGIVYLAAAQGWSLWEMLGT